MSGPPPAVAETRVRVRRALADLAADSLVLVACSGGADSLALAAATAFVAAPAGLRAGAVVVDHCLQSGSAAAAQRAADQCCALGLDPVAVVRVEVGSDGGPEAAARAARREALEAEAARLGAVAVLLGHTRDDQAETVLLGLARGSGARSLAGMRAVDGRWRRPLLEVPRQVTRQACLELGLAVWEDPHNDDAAYARVRVRQTALPALEDALGPGVAAALARSAALLGADADLLDELAARESTDDCVAMAALHPALRGRVLRRLALEAGVPAGSLSAQHVAAMDALVTNWRGQGTVALPAGWGARRDCGRLVLVEPRSD